MTIRELYDSVAQLGFEESIEYDKMFYTSTNRALIEVSRIRPQVKLYTIVHAPVPNLLDCGCGLYTHTDEDIVFECHDAKAFTFEVMGTNCKYYIEAMINGSWAVCATDTVNASAFTRKSGFVKYLNDFVTPGTPCRIRFSGSYRYYVRNIAMYGELLSDNASDIPEYGQYVFYRVRDNVADFAGMESPPVIDSDTGKVLDSTAMKVENDGTIGLKYELKGQFSVRYRHLPTQINADMDEDTELDVDNDTASLLPNLVASEIWLEDEPSLSQLYRNRYNEQVALIMSKDKDYTTATIRNSNGW